MGDVEVEVTAYRRHELHDIVWAIGGRASGFTAICRCCWESRPTDTRSMAKRSWERHVLSVVGIAPTPGTVRKPHLLRRVRGARR